MTADAKLLAEKIEAGGLCSLCDYNDGASAPLRDDVELIVRALRAYVSSDAQDAARYRWMRSSRWYVQVMSDLMDRYPKFCVIGTELDAAIDAELAKCFISGSDACP